MRITEPAARGRGMGSERSPRTQHGSVLVIVLWVAFGLVSLALYFGHSMRLEYRAAENRVATLTAHQAILGAARYLSNVLVNAETTGVLPDLLTYLPERVPVGDATFWLIGRDTNSWSSGPTQETYGLVDEASKLNLNTATEAMLELLPGMTTELAAAIVTWRSESGTASQGGVDDTVYQQLNPAYRCKHAPFDSIEELRLVYGMTTDLLFGEDANLNGVLDPNEDDADQSPPADDRNGRLDPGLLEYLTVYTHEPTTVSNSTARTSVASLTASALTNALTQAGLSEDRITAVVNQVIPRTPGGGGGGGGAPGGGTGGPGGGGASTNAASASFGSVLEFYLASGLTADEFALAEPYFMNTNLVGLVNVNTASETVLACIPGIGLDQASALVTYRNSGGNGLESVAWVAEALNRDTTTIAAAGPWITTRGYQHAADIAAVGAYGRGYARVRFVLDTSSGSPQIIRRQDLTHLGWALGTEARQDLLAAKRIR